MNLNTDQWKLYNLKSREGRNKENWTEPLRSMEDHKFTEMCIVKVPKGEDTEEGVENIQEIMVENFQNLITNINVNIQEI